jgi:hypothetical protein
VVFEGDLLRKSVMRELTDFGVTFWMMRNAGRRRTVVGSE